MTQSGHTMPSHTKTSGPGCRWHLITKPRDSSTEIVKQASAGSQHCVFELHHAAASSHDGCKHAAGLLQKALHKEPGGAKLRPVEVVAIRVRPQFVAPVTMDDRSRSGRSCRPSSALATREPVSPRGRCCSATELPRLRRRSALRK